jgi:hypothetical protein
MDNLGAGIWPFLKWGIKRAKITLGYPASESPCPSPQGVADFTEISGNFCVESVAALPWNHWQLSHGISGRIRPEYALCAFNGTWQLIKLDSGPLGQAHPV